MQIMAIDLNNVYVIDVNDGINANLGWEICSEFRGILQLFQFRTFWTPEFSSKFYLNDCKICSCQFVTRSCQFGILSRHWFFQFHALENVPAFFLAHQHHIYLFWVPTNITSTHFE